MTLRTLLENHIGLEVRSYSGRGMYGRTCLAFESDTPLQDLMKVGYELGQYNFEYPDGPVMPQDTRTDSMGLDTVVYWPSVPWEATDNASE